MPTPPDKTPTIASLRWCAHSVSGKRKPVNDDAWLAFSADQKGAVALASKGETSLKTHDLLFAVADGMGGGNAGDMASHFLLEELKILIPQTFYTAAAGLHPDYLDFLQQAVHATHTSLNLAAQQDSTTKGMATTLALAWFTPENLYLCNVGDSRIYVHSDLSTEQLSCDHSFAWKKWKRGEINERLFRSNPRRSALYEIVGGGHRSINMHLASYPYHPGDRFLLCSDGLIDGLWEKHIDKILANKKLSPSQANQALLTRAITNAGNDDTTLIIIDIAS